MSRLADKMVACGWVPAAQAGEWAHAAYAGHAVVKTAEFIRIFNLKRRVLNPEQVIDLSPAFVHTDFCAGNCGGLCDPETGRPARLLPIQSAALWEMDANDGLLGAIGVGHGKELTCALAATALGAKRVVIMSLPSLRDQFYRDWERYSIHFDLPAGVTFVAYSDISNPRTADVLEQLNPDLIVGNEVDALRHRTSARTKRFLRFMKAHPGCRFVGVSATITKDSLKDYAHLAELALGDKSPVPSPSRYYELGEWCSALDVPKRNELSRPPGVLLRFCDEHEITEARNENESPTDLARRGYQRRLAETPGVIVTLDASLKTRIQIRWRKTEIQVPEKIKEFLQHLDDTWSIPGGDWIDDPLELARIKRQASCGFYYVWDWPGGVVDKEWMEARSRWRKAVAHILRYSARKGLDTPYFVALAASRGDRLPGDANDAWLEWEPLKHRKQPPTKAIWLDNFVVEDALRWAGENQSGIIWSSHRALSEALALALGAPLFDAGTDKELIAAKPTTHPIIVCSIAAHHKGKNLQGWSKNLVVTPPSSGPIWEQLLGRTHRQGQKADVVQVDVNVHTDSLISAIDAALEEAKYQSTIGNPQRILFAEVIGK